jgi:hypothetical protein
MRPPRAHARAGAAAADKTHLCSPRPGPAANLPEVAFHPSRARGSDAATS